MSYPNGGFPPIKLIINNSKKDNKKISKERSFTSSTTDLNIKNILNQSIIKPMININPNKIDIIDSL
jgi:hypothetical protein